MTLAETIKTAVDTNDASLAGRIADSMRAIGHRYTGIFNAFNKATGIEAADFDALMYEADELANRS